VRDGGGRHATLPHEHDPLELREAQSVPGGSGMSRPQ
jgi:hypothetical protein